MTNVHSNAQTPISDVHNPNTNSPMAHHPIAHMPRIAIAIAAVLIVGGCVHLVIYLALGASWEGPVSPRKPALFGISGGVTAWSLAWVITQIAPRKLDRPLVNAMSIGLLVEVGLITMQYWRGVASHFNHATPLDTAIEMVMLVLILLVTLGIFYLTIRTSWLREIAPEMKIAIRAGMWLLSLSCLLGIATSVLGNISFAAGRGYETWGRAGVLKFPHGVALHAIQVLPILAWLCRYRRLHVGVRAMIAAVASQLLFLVFAVWQTSQGRDRFDCDWVGGGILSVVVLLALFPAIALMFSRTGHERHA